MPLTSSGKAAMRPFDDELEAHLSKPALPFSHVYLEQQPLVTNYNLKYVFVKILTVLASSYAEKLKTNCTLSCRVSINPPV